MIRRKKFKNNNPMKPAPLLVVLLPLLLGGGVGSNPILLG